MIFNVYLQTLSVRRAPYQKSLCVSLDAEPGKDEIDRIPNKSYEKLTFNQEAISCGVRRECEGASGLQSGRRRYHY